MSARLPKEIKVGAHSYSVKLVPQGELPDALGNCDPNTQIIKIVRHLKLQKKREVILHETLHAIHYLSNIDEEVMSDERWVTMTAPLLLGVLRDNPKLMEYILAEAI